MEPPPRVASWLRTLLTADATITRLVGGYFLARDELLFALVPPEQRGALGHALYARTGAYVPGGSVFARGLFEHERDALEHPAFPKRGTILVPGAGGGREVVALLERGYDVIAFDPCVPYAQALDELLRGRPHSLSACADFGALVEAARGRGPLQELAGREIDASILGWGSLSHVRERTDRDALLAAIAALTHHAPVFVSASGMPPHSEPTPGRLRARAGIRAAFARVGRECRAESGEYFHPAAGFLVRIDCDEICRLASAHGYDVARMRADPVAHALLVRR